MYAKGVGGTGRSSQGYLSVGERPSGVVGRLDAGGRVYVVLVDVGKGGWGMGGGANNIYASLSLLSVSSPRLVGVCAFLPAPRARKPDLGGIPVPGHDGAAAAGQRRGVQWAQEGPPEAVQVHAALRAVHVCQGMQPALWCWRANDSNQW